MRKMGIVKRAVAVAAFSLFAVLTEGCHKKATDVPCDLPMGMPNGYDQLQFTLTSRSDGWRGWQLIEFGEGVSWGVSFLGKTPSGKARVVINQLDARGNPTTIYATQLLPGEMFQHPLKKPDPITHRYVLTFKLCALDSTLDRDTATFVTDMPQ